MKKTFDGAKREFWVDWMRVLACLMVFFVHSSEPFYIGGDGTLVLSRSDAFWVSFFDSFARACVPIFVVASSYLQFPLHYGTGEFLRRRAGRILIPFFIWTVIYALAWGDPVKNFKDLLVNFNFAAGHLWFVYMLVGLYLLMPLLSPWAERVGKKELSFYLMLCFLTTFIPLIRELASGANALFAYGPGNVAVPGHFPLWGEAVWNEFGILYYLSGFIGYLLLGLYFRKFVGELSWKKTLSVALPCFAAGFAICFGGFLSRVFVSSGGIYPVEGDITMSANWETLWVNNSPGVALMTVGWILLFKKMDFSGRFYTKVVAPVSKASYGMYLCHMLILAAFASLYRNALGIGGQGCLGVMTTPVEIIATAISTYICTAIACVLVQRIPKVGKWFIG